MNKIASLFLIAILLGCNSKRSKETFEKEDWWLWSAAWNAKGDLIAVGGTQDTLRIFTETEFKNNYPVPGTITDLSWHPNSNLLAIATQGDNAKSILKDIDSEQEVVLDSINGSRAVGWSKNGEYLAIGDNDGFLTVFNSQGVLLKRVNLEQWAVTGLSWHPKKNILATVGHHIVLYNFDNEEMTKIIPRDEEVLMLCVEWHPSGNFFVTGDYGDSDFDHPALLQFWDEKGNKIREIEQSKAEYRNLKWTQDGKTLATASDAIRLWSEEGKLIKERKVEKLLWGIDWSKDNSRIITTDDIGNLVVWNTELEIVDTLEY